MNTMLDVQIFFNIVNLVSRGVLERQVGCYDHSAKIKEYFNTRAFSFHKHLIKCKDNDNNFSI